MCEIFVQRSREGSISEEGLDEILEKAIRAAQVNDDGWGVFNEEKEVWKTSEQFNREIADAVKAGFKDSKFIVIHLRLASEGDVSDRNAHPFYKKYDGGKEVLVHNGSLHIEKEDGKTDSEELLDRIHEDDGETTVERIKNIMENVFGSASVVFYDENEDLYYFRRTSDFSFMYIEELNEIYGATKEKRLSNMFKEDQLGFFENNKYEKNIREVPEGNIYKISDTIEDVGEIKTYQYHSTYKNGSRVIERYKNRRMGSKNNDDEEDEDGSDNNFQGEQERLGEEDSEEINNTKVEDTKKATDDHHNRKQRNSEEWKALVEEWHDTEKEDELEKKEEWERSFLPF